MQIQISWLLKKPTNLDLHCLQRQAISGFSRTRVKSQFNVYLFEAFIVEWDYILYHVLILSTSHDTFPHFCIATQKVPYPAPLCPQILAGALLLIFNIAWRVVTRLPQVLLNPNIPCLYKQCRSRSVGFSRRHRHSENETKNGTTH